jgi:hypothetical protein
MGFKSTLVVEMVGGDTYDVVIDQRDLAAAEADDNGSPDRIHTRIRFLGWHAAKREERYTGTFRAFNEKDCVDVMGKPDPKEKPDTDGDGTA